MPKQRRQTSLIELTETRNLYLAFVRVGTLKGWNSEPTKHALYHAMHMSGQFTTTTLQNVRIALELP